MMAVVKRNQRVFFIVATVATLLTFQASLTRILDRILAITENRYALTEFDVVAFAAMDTRRDEQEREISLGNTNENGITIDSIKFGSLGPSGSEREKLRYYDTLFALTLQFGQNARTILEVGCASVPFIGQLPWIESRVCVAPYNVKYPKSGAKRKKEKGMHVEMIEADFYTWNASKHFDLVLCSQVVEHLPDPQAFVQKLLKVADTAIISVPYKWPKKKTPAIAHHITHEIDEDMFRHWASPRKPVVTAIVSEDEPGSLNSRIIMVFQKKVQRPKTTSA